MFQKEGMRDMKGQCTQIIIYSNGLMHSTFLQRNLFSYLPVAGVHGKYMLFCLFNHTKTPTYHPMTFITQQLLYSYLDDTPMQMYALLIQIFCLITQYISYTTTLSVLSLH